MSDVLIKSEYLFIDRQILLLKYRTQNHKVDVFLFFLAVSEYPQQVVASHTLRDLRQYLLLVLFRKHHFDKVSQLFADFRSECSGKKEIRLEGMGSVTHRD